MYRMTTAKQGIALQPGTTAHEVAFALDSFLTTHDVEFHPMMDLEELEDMKEGSIPVFDEDCRFELKEGHLHLRLNLKTMPMQRPDMDAFKRAIAELAVGQVDELVTLEHVA